MKRSGFRALVLAAVFGITTLGCSDATAPEGAAAPRGNLLATLLEVDLLQRLLPLGQSHSAAATIGPAGGSIRIPQAGMTIAFPAGAVQAPVTVRVTAHRGSNVAYTFEPHGLRFQNRPVITQDLGITQVVQRLLLARSLEGVYFASESQISGSTATVQEAIPASVDLLRMRMSFPVSHFSGYAASSGRRGGGYLTASGTRIAPGGVR
ncbi:MAG TPA: hypothetical protein VFS20_27885 [Longimicrobium sp.]|nr:hypothetical protein [Longimicrobium sp.]